MSKAMKTAIVDQVTRELSGHDSAVVFSAGRLTVLESEELRTKLREAGMSCLFLRNRLAAIAFKNAGMDGLETVLDGPAAVAYGGEEGAIAIAKVLMKEAKTLKNLEMLGGILDGEILDAAGVEKISMLPGKKELQSMVLQGMFGPVSDFAASMDDLLTEVQGLIGALEDKGGAGA
ncbi:MAG: 50S ribosomal protein L10 [Planctomycetota bacterium]